MWRLLFYNMHAERIWAHADHHRNTAVKRTEINEGKLNKTTNVAEGRYTRVPRQYVKKAVVPYILKIRLRF